MGKIFVNYRRGDDPGFTQALYMRLEDEFPAADIFMDVEGHIKPGDDFVEVLNAQVAACDVLLVVIGPRWQELLIARSGDPDDFVQVEIKAGLELGKRVIPVLVGGASMPNAIALPDSIRPLARRNAVGLRPERFKADSQGLIASLNEQIAAAQADREARTEAERQAAEEIRKKREAEEAARAAEAEKRAQEQARAGLAPDEIRKAEELANWQFVEGRDDISELRDHLARFPNGVTERYALEKLEGLVWASLGGNPDTEQLQDFVDEFPTGANAELARSQLEKLQEEAARAREQAEQDRRETEDWANTSTGDVTAVKAFLKKWPNGQHANAAQSRIRELRRNAKGRSHAIWQGAAATVAMFGLVYAGVVAYDWWRWQATLTDETLDVLTAAKERDLRKGDTFKECASCPEMVVVPAGSFMMGSSPANDSGNFHDEGPQRSVTFAKPFAVGRFELTFDEWDACVIAGACGEYKPTDSGWGRGRRPVFGLSWNDAQAYAKWLSAKTGKTYRLLSESEWEYAARAGTNTLYPWGDDIGRNNANCAHCGSQWGNKKTAPVGSFKPNAFGLHDMHGNLWEWVQDCHKYGYNGAPSDGSAVTASNCEDYASRVVRGGSWINTPRNLRSAERLSHLPWERNKVFGMRVARTLTP